MDHKDLKNESYVGDRREGDGAKHGLGRMTFADGATYEGEWADNLPHGTGVYVSPSEGSVY